MIFDGIEIENMVWVNEFEFEPVEQERVRAVTGNLVVFERPFVGGEAMQLTGGWVDRQTLRQINARRAMAGIEYEIELDDGRKYDVAFNRATESVIAEPVVGPYTVPSDDDKYSVTLNLLIMRER